jgi:hypothetical protein
MAVPDRVTEQMRWGHKMLHVLHTCHNMWSVGKWDGGVTVCMCTMLLLNTISVSKTSVMSHVISLWCR